VHGNNLIETTALEHWQVYKDTLCPDYKDKSTHRLCLVFSITNYCNGGGNLNIRRKSYIFVHTTVDDINKLISTGESLIKDYDKDKEKRRDLVQILGAGYKLYPIRFEDIR